MDKNKMLIDATHPEETRVVAVRNGRVEEFDFESAARKLLRGNIYLAKVTRVEPSLQAAFIDYGGNRHGFLAFNEIHPDYYQIPVADREALKQEEAEAEQRAEEEAEERARSRGPRRRRRSRDRSGGGGERDGGRNGTREDYAPGIDTFEDGYHTPGTEGGESEPEAISTTAELRHSTSADDVRHGEAEPPVAEASDTEPVFPATSDLREADAGGPDAAPAPIAPPPPAPVRPVASSWTAEAHDAGDATQLAETVTPIEAPAPSVEMRDVPDADDSDETGEGNGSAEDETVEQVSTEEDALEEVPERPRRRARQYKIQEVIKRRQVMLVQVVKEERGNKGAALTTYISLAGRYTVLMPNTARGGGISRKITQPQDRKRLKAIAEELDVEEGMGLIVRTAGAARTMQEIKRDYDYLMRLWESVRDLTLSSTAPCLVYEEGNIIKRAIRDLYSKDFDQIVVAGDAAHHEAQGFMEMLMPGSAGQVASYRAPEPLFARYGIERQLNALFSPYVTLRSGGYIVINQTEALVSVDVNSGKSTREFSIEETALNTNLEAAEEIARQLKLRDLAGLIVVDFIDMEEKRNNRSVERRLKDALRHDRARIQVGRISHFGLLEMSRQRLRAGVLEGSTSQCPHCQGTGIIRSIESVALAVLRGLEDHLLKQPTSVVAQTTAEVALYILNHKRAFITEMERRHGVTIRVEGSDRMQGANFAVERIAIPVAAAPRAAAVSLDWGFDRDEAAGEEADDHAGEAGDDARRGTDDEQHARGEGGDEDRRGRRRRRRRGRRDREGESHETNGAHDESGAAPDDASHPETEPRETTVAARTYDEAEAEDGDADGDADTDQAVASRTHDAERGESEGEGGERRRGRRRGRRGGRARRREGGDGLPNGATGHAASDTDGHEWGIAEVARPGAEQPTAYAPAPWRDRAVGLVGSAEASASDAPFAARSRPSIVEDAPQAAHGTSAFASCAAEAVRLALVLAGSTDPAAAEPPRRSEQPAVTPPPAAPVLTVVASSVTVSEVAAFEPVATRAAAPIEVEPEAVETHEMRPTASAESEDRHSDTAMAASSESSEAGQEASAPSAAADPEAPRAPARRGWWQRRFGGAE